MAQKTIQISLGSAEEAAVRHVLAAAQADAIGKTGRKDATLDRVEKKIAKASADAATKASPKGEETKDGDDAES